MGLEGGRRWELDSPESWNVCILREEGAGSLDFWVCGRRGWMPRFLSLGAESTLGSYH